MKIRIGFVSNSSSSSFIVCEDLTNKGIACLKLTRAQKELINDSLVNNNQTRIGLDLDRDIYLTEFVSDCDDERWSLVTSIEHVIYESGQMCGEPYTDDEYYNEYKIDGDTSIYLRKDHDVAKQMKFSKFIKEIKDVYGSKIDVIVKYENKNEINLKIVD